MVINGIALFDTPGERTLHYDVEGSLMASLTDRQLDSSDVFFDEADPVETTTIDRYCDRHEIDRTDLKIDVEGHELDVLRGATEMIDADSVDHVSFEFGGANVDMEMWFKDYF